MRHGESELEMVRQHIRLGERHLADQREIVRHFEKRGWSVETAERLLHNMEDMQKLHRDHAHRIACEGWGTEDPPLIR